MDNGIGGGDVTGTITAMHLVLIAILAVIAILAIWWGGRRRAARRGSRAEAIERRDAAPDTAATPDIAPAPVPEIERPTPTPPPPVAPPPPPLAGSDEAIPAAAPLDAETPPAAEPAPAVAETSEGGQPVTILKGLGPKVAARLAELGITEVDQIAALSEPDAAALDDQLGTFKGRMERDRWIEQARLLSAGDKAGFEAKFGKLG